MYTRLYLSVPRCEQSNERVLEGAVNFQTVGSNLDPPPKIGFFVKFWSIYLAVFGQVFHFLRRYQAEFEHEFLFLVNFGSLYIAVFRQVLHFLCRYTYLVVFGQVLHFLYLSKILVFVFS